MPSLLHNVRLLRQDIKIQITAYQPIYSSGVDRVGVPKTLALEESVVLAVIVNQSRNDRPQCSLTRHVLSQAELKPNPKYYTGVGFSFVFIGF